MYDIIHEFLNKSLFKNFIFEELLWAQLMVEFFFQTLNQSLKHIEIKLEHLLS